MKRIVSSLIIGLLFLSLFAFALTLQTARAQSGTIIINPGGSITPLTANITTSDNITYTFSGNNYLPIVVNRSNIIINGMGHTLRGPLPYTQNGFSLTDVSNVTVKNTTITNSFCGIYLDSSSHNNTLSGNNVTANIGDGIYLHSCDNNTLSDNNVTANAIGIDLVFSSGNVLSGNNVTANNAESVDLVFSSGNVLSDNVMAGNNGNFGVYGSVSSDFVNHVDTSNLVDGKPVYYLVNESNMVISPQKYPSGVGYLGLVNCKNVTVQGVTLTKNVEGLLLANTTNSKITGNNVTANIDYGIYLGCYSSGNVFSRNNVTQNSSNGFDLEYYCDNNTLSGNNVTANIGDGIYLYSCDNNTLSGNNVTANSEDGFDLYYSSGNTLSGNNVTANGEDGIYLDYSSSNRIFHNDFLNNTQQAVVSSSNDTWDDGYPSGGNYWSDYRTRYPIAVENDSSGIWNTPYNVSSGNIDMFPLMGPFHTFGVGTWNGIEYSVDTVSNSTITNVSFNAATKTLSFNVTGTNGTMGFCRVAIPLSLMSGEWKVTVNGASIAYSTATYGNCTYVYFTYHHSIETVKITSTSAIPEFQPSMLLLLLMMITLLTATVSKRKRNVKK